MSEDTPLLYTSFDGTFTCKVTHGEKQISGIFEINRKLEFNHLQLSLILTTEAWDGIIVKCPSNNKISISQKGTIMFKKTYLLTHVYRRSVFCWEELSINSWRIK